jgi:hypothetical protein
MGQCRIMLWCLFALIRGFNFSKPILYFFG